MSRDQTWWDTQDGDDAWQHEQMQQALRREEEEREEREIKELEDSLRQWEEEHDDGALFIPGMEDALIGVAVQFAHEVAVYDYDKCLDILIGRDGMNVEDAVEYMEYNVVGAYAGKRTPVFLIRTESYQDDVTPQLEQTKQDSTQSKDSKQINIQLEFNF